MAITPECNPAAEVQGPGPNSGDGNPIDVNVLTLPPVVIPGCVKVEDCPTGTPVRVTVQNFPASQAVTIADGADVAEGATTDAANITGATGTVSGKLRGLVTILANVWDSVSGLLRVGGSATPSDTFANPTKAVLSESFSMLYDDTSSQWRRARNALKNGNTLDTGVFPCAKYLFTGTTFGASPTALNTPDGNGGQGLDTTAIWRWNGAFYEKVRLANIFKTVQAVAAGNTALWTPAAGKKFRLMRYMVQITGNGSLAVAGVLTVTLFDGAAGATNQTHDIFVPALALAGIGLYTSPWIDIGNGYLSVLANNVLNVNLSAALVTGNVRIVVAGTEE